MTSGIVGVRRGLNLADALFDRVFGRRHKAVDLLNLRLYGLGYKRFGSDTV